MVRRRAIQFALPVALVCGVLLPNATSAEEATDAAALKSRFEHLSQHGNVEFPSFVTPTEGPKGGSTTRGTVEGLASHKFGYFPLYWNVQTLAALTL